MYTVLPGTNLYDGFIGTRQNRVAICLLMTFRIIRESVLAPKCIFFNFLAKTALKYMKNREIKK